MTIDNARIAQIEHDLKQTTIVLQQLINSLATLAGNQAQCEQAINNLQRAVLKMVAVVQQEEPKPETLN